MTGRGHAKEKKKNRSSAASASPAKKGVPTKSPPGLALVATPIGNARDITLRALDVLEQADVIACEDTRVTAKLLAIHGISRPLTAYHDHNAASARPGLIRRLKKGETVALVSDAGTPLVSDPGYKLVLACLDEGIPVIPLPGASSVLAALVVSGLPAARFFFSGFLPAKRAARRRALSEAADIPGALVFMESAKRLAPSLADMADVLGEREAVICREMTKKFEEVRRGGLADLAGHYQAQGAPKGEVTVVIAPGTRKPVDDAELDRLLGNALKSSTVRDAADAVSAETGLPRKQVYTRALKLKPGIKKG
jgi:16S rRNA (cytidine1402-2'-O)-methyltransferase